MAARITHGATMSHVPIIGRTIDTDQTETDYWKPAFAGFDFSSRTRISAGCSCG